MVSNAGGGRGVGNRLVTCTNLCVDSKKSFYLLRTHVKPLDTRLSGREDLNFSSTVKPLVSYRICLYLEFLLISDSVRGNILVGAVFFGTIRTRVRCFM